LAWEIFTGEKLLESTAWFRQRFGTLLMQTWPGHGDNYGRAYRLYPSVGDAERNRHSIQNYGRIIGLMLATRFPDEPLARQLLGAIGGVPATSTLGFLYADEFMWSDPALL